MTPHLVKWHEQYAADGLAVVEINNGQMDSLEALQEHASEEGILFPLLHDAGGQVSGRFGVRAYPTAYLIGRDGSVIWEGHPGQAAIHEAAIQQALQN